MGGKVCSVISFNHTVILCSVPSGEGVSLSVAVTVSGQSASSPLFSYDPPSVTSIASSDTNTAGGGLLTVSGTNFGSSGYIVINGQVCSSSSLTHTLVICSIPAGAGSLIPVYVKNLARSSGTLFFNYSAPTVSTLSPSVGSTDGVQVTIDGSNFGTPAGYVTIGGSSCILSGSGWSHTRIVCTAPAGQGRNLSTFVHSSGQSNAVPVYFSYSAPSITSVVPLAGITSGGDVITIIGANLGTSGTTKVGAIDCVETFHSHTKILCSTGSGDGLGLGITVNIDGQMSTSLPPYLFSYSSPTMTR